MTPVLEVRDLAYRQGGRDVLRGVSFAIAEHELVGLIGPNGGGKTTLLKLVLGVLAPHAGSIRVFGREPGALGAERAAIGYVAQARHFEREFPARAKDVVLMGTYAQVGLFRLPGAREKEQALRALDAVGMLDRAERAIGRLSGGEQQRVFIARALASGPRLLILDEPTVGVDREGEEGLLDLLLRLRERGGLTVLMVSHNVSLIRTHTDRILCLNREIYFAGPARELGDGVIAEAYHAHRRGADHD